jgi:GTP cyclohydrolase FolE2
MPKIERFSDWVNSFNELLCSQTYTLMDNKCDSDKEALNSLASNYVARFVSAMVEDTLRRESGKKMTKAEQYKFTEDNFRNMKSLIQESVAAGVAKAMTEFSGQSMEYYCLIKPVPKVSGKVC